MRLFATVLFVACCAVSIAGCSGRGYRHWCPFGDRFRHRHCVDRNDWDRCDDDWEGDFDDDDDGCSCGCHRGHAMPQCGAPCPTPVFDSGCGCDGGMSMPTYYGGMPMTFDSFPQSTGCSSCASGGIINGPSYPTYSQPMMMSTPTMAPTPTPAVPPNAPGAEAYFDPKASNAASSTSTTIPPKY